MGMLLLLRCVITISCVSVMSKTRAQKSKHGGTRPRTSNIFSMFDQTQIQEFKEAFNIIDQNRDGFIDARDLREMMLSLGESK